MRCARYYIRFIATAVAEETNNFRDQLLGNVVYITPGVLNCGISNAATN